MPWGLILLVAALVLFVVDVVLTKRLSSAGLACVVLAAIVTGGAI
jgi:hypothetical protein